MSIDERTDHERLLRPPRLRPRLQLRRLPRLLLNRVRETLRQAGAEFVGTGLLVAVIIGSGIMAERLTDDGAVRLLAASIATALGLLVLIVVLQPLSGAHLNPVVTLAERAIGRPAGRTTAFVLAQCLGAIGGALLANAMFGVGTRLATTSRAEASTLLGELVATAVLVIVILALSRTGRAGLIAPAVAAWIGAAYWATSSTAFANPAVTLGRVFSDTFAGIDPSSALWFVGAELIGGALGLALVLLLFPGPRRKATA